MKIRDDIIKKFYREIYQPPKAMETFISRIKPSLTEISEEMSLAKIISILNAEKTMVRDEVVDGELLLLDTGKKTGDVFSTHFVNGDGSRLEMQFWKEEGLTFTEEEKAYIPVIANPIYMMLSYITISQLLECATNMDLVVGVANLTAFNRHVNGLVSDDKIDDYHAAYVNLHNFKYINRVLSYQGGNEMLKRFAQTIQKNLAPDEMIARLGGDNFVVLIRNENVEKICGLLQNMVLNYEDGEKPRQFVMTVTMGISHLREVCDMGDIMLRISVAYQKAREKQSGSCVFYTDEILKKVMNEKEIIAHFNKALANEEFVIYYQPKIKTIDNTINGAEALVRWKRDDKIVPPGEFIPVLEKDGSICHLDFYVLRCVCKFLRQMQQEGLPFIKISVNFSKCHMDNDQLADQIAEVIDSYEIPHKYIEIELTESEDFEDYAVIAKLVNNLREKGIYTSIDDFGAGFSSLNLLRMTRVDLLKIDRAFIPMEEEFERKFRDLVMFKNIVRMAKELGIQIVAEGVETKEQYDYVSTTGCDMIQGYYFDKPLPKEEFLEKLKIGKY